MYRHEISRVARWFGIFYEAPREHWALKDVDFRLSRGESLGVIGGNGAGKTTLLKVVTGTVKPTCGSVSVMGTSAAILELGLNFHPDLTGRDNVLFHAAMLGVPPREAVELEPSIREFADIGEAYLEPMRTYSTGMQARVAFAVATARRPDLLIVDEILSVGDAAFQHKSFGRIAEYRSRGTALLFVTHALDGIESLCERAIWLKRGQVAMMGGASEVCAAYRDSLTAN